VWGGIAELMTDQVDGVLVEFRSTSAWSTTLGKLAEDRSLGIALSKGVRPLRSMADAAADMSGIYARLPSFARQPQAIVT
jgi:hypothetical protein